MIVLRVARGITDHFPVRISEWSAGLILFNWGWILLLPQVTFDGHDMYDFMARIASEHVWGLACLLVGLSRLMALVLNGTFKEFQYAPHIRAGTAGLSCFLWLQMTLGTLHVPLSMALAVYPVLLAVDMYNTLRAAAEAGEYAGAIKHGTTTR